MEPLPYFLLLLKKNVLLCSIIAHSSFTQVDLSHIEHIVRSENCVSLLNFKMAENEEFSSVDVILTDEGTSITFNTTKSDYYDHPERYFQRSGTERSSQPYMLYGQEAQTQKKRLGRFELFGPDIPSASINVMQSNVYGYAIFIGFYKFNLPAKVEE